MVASARDAPTLPRGPFDLAPISSVTSPLSAGRRIPASRIPKIQRSRWATQSKAKRRVERGHKSSTPVLWQRSMSKWRTDAARAAGKKGSGEGCFAVQTRLRRRKGGGSERADKKSASNQRKYVR